MAAQQLLDILDDSAISASRSLPLHHQVRRFLRDAIEEHFEDGQSFWTESLLVERLGVSRITVRRALDELARDGLIVREASRRTFVRKVAVTSIGVLFPRVASDYLVEMLQHFAGQCLERGLHLQLYPTSDSVHLDGIIDKIQRPAQEERLILMASGRAHGKYLHEALAEKGYRTITLEESSYTNPGSMVATDGEAAVRIAVEHLRGMGHRRICFLVNEPVAHPMVQRKIREFEYLVKSGDFDGRLLSGEGVAGSNSFDLAYSLMPLLWEPEPRPTALFTASDPGAWAALRWFAQRKIEVPEDVSVLGFEGVKPDAFTHPPLSTVAHSFTDLARRAVELLLDNNPQARQEFVPPHLIVRESTGPCPPA